MMPWEKTRPLPMAIPEDLNHLPNRPHANGGPTRVDGLPARCVSRAFQQDIRPWLQQMCLGRTLEARLPRDAPVLIREHQWLLL